MHISPALIEQRAERMLRERITPAVHEIGRAHV